MRNAFNLLLFALMMVVVAVVAGVFVTSGDFWFGCLATLGDDGRSCGGCVFFAEIVNTTTAPKVSFRILFLLNDPQ